MNRVDMTWRSGCQNEDRDTIRGGRTCAFASALVYDRYTIGDAAAGGECVPQQAGDGYFYPIFGCKSGAVGAITRDGPTAARLGADARAAYAQVS